MVTIEEKGDETHQICIVTRGGVCTREDTSTSYVNKQPWVRKEMKPLPKLNLAKEKKTY